MGDLDTSILTGGGAALVALMVFIKHLKEDLKDKNDMIIAERLAHQEYMGKVYEVIVAARIYLEKNEAALTEFNQFQGDLKQLTKKD